MTNVPKIIPVSELRQNASNVIKGTSSGEPVFITQRGRATAVMVSMKAYEQSQHEMDILHLLALGEKEIEVGAGLDFGDMLKEADHFLEATKS